MHKFFIKYHKKLAALVIVSFFSILMLFFHFSGLLDNLEYRFYDLRINFFAPSSRVSDDIIVVLLDQQSIDWAYRERGWAWPWPRYAYGEFVDYMNLGGARSVIFDVLFSESSIYSQFNIADDDAFAEAAAIYGNVVQGVMLSTVSGSRDSWPYDLTIPLFKPENFGEFISVYDLLGRNGSLGAQFPIPALRNSAGAIGSLTGISDSDNIFRSQHLFMIFDDKAVPSLAAAALLAAGEDEHIFYDIHNRQIQWGSHRIPVDERGKSLLRFRGTLNRYPSYSMSMVLQSAEDHSLGLDPFLPPENFENAYVFFGLFAQGLFDTFSTPIDSVYPGMGVHITMLDNILMGDFISKVPFWAEALMIFLPIVTASILVLFSRRIRLTLSGLFASITIILLTGFLAFNGGFWLPMAAPLGAFLLSFISATVYSYATEGKDKRFIKHAFSRIISPKVVEQIIADPSQLKLGGEKRQLSAIFTDVQRFSTIASELQDQYGEDGPKTLVNMLNLYLTEMSNIILSNGGTIDKYQGDAIVAFFGAPLWMEDHAARACRSAIEMKKRELELRNDILNPQSSFYDPMSKLINDGVIRNDRPIFTRFGINSGDMVVGFMGTPEKMDYTIMGHAVNLASRLEGVNKQYDTKGILISENTKNLIGDEFLVRSLSRVTVYGIPAPIKLFELLDLKENAGTELIINAERWEKAYAAYLKSDFIAAEKLFSIIYEIDPLDTTAKFYLNRCKNYITIPPENWNGIDSLEEK